MTAFEQALLPVDATILEAMSCLEANTLGIVLLIDGEGRLMGVATDGDIRRAILRGGALDDRLAPHMNVSFVYVEQTAGRAEVLDLMQARRVEQVPVLGPDRRPVGIHLLREMLGPVDRPNWAVVMAGGQGTRLRPLTDSIPKPMLRVAGRPILERIVLHVVGFGIRRVFISINYLGHVIEEHFGDGAAFGCRIEYLRETKPLGTGGSLSLLPEMPTDPLLLMNGDLVTQADLGTMLDVHAASRSRVTIGVRRYLHTVPFGCIEREGDRVTAMEEKPTIERIINGGIYVLDPSVVATVGADAAVTAPEIASKALIRGDRVGTFEIQDDWVDVGQRDQLAQARGDIG